MVPLLLLESAGPLSRANGSSATASAGAAAVSGLAGVANVGGRDGVRDGSDAVGAVTADAASSPVVAAVLAVKMTGTGAMTLWGMRGGCGNVATAGGAGDLLDDAPQRDNHPFGEFVGGSEEVACCRLRSYASGSGGVGGGGSGGGSGGRGGGGMASDTPDELVGPSSLPAAGLAGVAALPWSARWQYRNVWPNRPPPGTAVPREKRLPPGNRGWGGHAAAVGGIEGVEDGGGPNSVEGGVGRGGSCGPGGAPGIPPNKGNWPGVTLGGS